MSHHAARSTLFPYTTLFRSGASEDHSRIIRHSYHSSNYTALTPSAYATWAELEDETGLQLVVKTGGLDIARQGTDGVHERSEEHTSELQSRQYLVCCLLLGK